MNGRPTPASGGRCARSALLEAKAIRSGRPARAHLQMLAETNDIPRRRVDEVIGMVGLESVAGQRGVAAPGHCHLHRPGEVVDEQLHRLVHIGAGDRVVVIEHQHDRARQRGQRVDQQRQRQVGHIPAG
ncbi:MAG TPA: hypothetical protein VMC03_18295 [Streptosporangiaceae bacterium]|nr:hypothetical protein [Streptosporangiaceae bacterium]